MDKPFSTATRSVFLTKPGLFFTAPEKAGRRIVCGFSYLQRIGKAATTDVWFPASVQEKVGARLLAGDASVLDEFRVEWAAVRQFELMQEAGNLSIEDLEVANFKKSYEYLQKMRAGGYRVTVITLGRYAAPGHHDELHILDRRLQDEITRLIHMLYLDEQSAELTEAQQRALRMSKWRSAEALPHVAITLGAMNLFGKGNAHSRRQERLSQRFFQLLDLLSKRHVLHDVAVGLTLPEAVAQRNWVYLAKPEHQYHAFQQALSTVFASFDHISLGALQGRQDATREIMPTMHHMRAHGDRLNAKAEAQNRAQARYLMENCGYGSC